MSTLTEEEKKKRLNTNPLVNNNTNNQTNLLKQHYGNNNQTDLQKFYGKNSNTNVSLLSNTVPTNVNVSSSNNNVPTTTTPSKSSIVDNWYNNAIQRNEQNRNAELEQNYVKQQLMEKYLPQDMKVNGLSGSGLAELYKQKAKTDYMNNRATINANYNDSNQSLFENYTNKKLEIADAEKAESDQNILDWYTRMHDGLTTKIDEFRDEETGKLSEEDYNSLYKYIEDNKGNINNHYESLLKNYLDEYKMNEEQIAEYNSKQVFEDNYAGLVENTEGLDISTPAKASKAIDDNSDAAYLYAYQQYFDLKDGDILQTGLKKSDKYIYYNGKFYKLIDGINKNATYTLNDFPKNTGGGGGSSFGGRR